MSDTLLLLLGLIIIILIISVLALVRNKNLRQILHLPGGVTWDMETRDSGQDVISHENRRRNIKSSDEQKREGGVNFGQKNKFKEKIGDVAGRDIIEGDNAAGRADRAAESGGVDFGQQNTFSGGIEDIAGRDIVKKTNSNDRKAGSKEPHDNKS